MNIGEIVIAISLMVCIGIVIAMVRKRQVPEKNQEANAEVIKKYIIDLNHRKE